MGEVLIFITAVILMVFSEGTGRSFLRLLHLETENYAAPVGTAVIFCLLELFYMPIMSGNASFGRVSFVTVLVLLTSLVGMLSCAHETVHTLFRKKTVYVVISGLLFMGIFTCCKGSLSIEMSSELAEMSRNLNASAVIFPEGSLQGYSLLGSFVMGICRGEAENTMLLLGVYANMVTAMLLLNIVDSFKIGNPWFRFTLILASLFYYPFTSLKIVGAFNSGNWRIFFIACVLYDLFQWVRTGNDRVKYTAVMAIGAGLFVHRGFFMIAVEIIYCLSAWMLCSKKIRSLADIMLFLLPVVIYACIVIMQKRFLLGFVLLLAYVTVYVMRSHRKAYHYLIRIEDVIMEHSRTLFYILIPAIFLIGTVYLRFFVPACAFSFEKYFDYFSQSYLKSYLFLSCSFTDVILNLFRWIGMFIFILRACSDEENMIRHIFLGMVIFFVNPLCMGLLSEITGYERYAYAFEILLNPFTDVMIFYWIYTQFEWTVVGQWILELSLIGCMLYGHLSGFTGMKGSLYGELLDPDKVVEVNLP